MKVNAIFGPPGTGKTRTLIAQAAQSPARHSVFLSFTKAAAAEVLKRAPDMKASTLHSMAYSKMSLSPASIVNARKLQEFAEATGIPFRTKDDTEAQDGDVYYAINSYAANQMIRSEEAYDVFGRPGTPAGFEYFIKSYANWKKTYGFADFNDMLELALKVKFNHIDHLYLDEAQDCSPLQWKLFEKIAVSADEVTIAGDDDQAIFEWSGADPHGMIDFVTRHDGTIHTLDRSYRVPKKVHTLAHDHVLAVITKRVDKKFAPAPRNGQIINFGSMEDVNYASFADKDTMILVRDQYRLREAQKLLHADNVPYSVVGAVSPYENWHAAALRGWHRARNGTKPSDDEIKAMLKASASPGTSWEDLARKPWRSAFSIPARLSEFYEHADLFADLRVRLSTIHRAKGAEADHVILDLTLSAMAEEALYSNRDAEARVLYVGLTRCRHDLHLCGDHPLFADEYDAWN